MFKDPRIILFGIGALAFVLLWAGLRYFGVPEADPLMQFAQETAKGALALLLLVIKSDGMYPNVPTTKE